MRKKLMILLSCVVILSALAGCGASGPSGAGGSGPEILEPASGQDLMAFTDNPENQGRDLCDWTSSDNIVISTPGVGELIPFKWSNFDGDVFEIQPGQPDGEAGISVVESETSCNYFDFGTWRGSFDKIRPSWETVMHRLEADLNSREWPDVMSVETDEEINMRAEKLYDKSFGGKLSWYYLCDGRGGGMASISLEVTGFDFKKFDFDSFRAETEALLGVRLSDADLESLNRLADSSTEKSVELRNHAGRAHVKYMIADGNLSFYVIRDFVNR